VDDKPKRKSPHYVVDFVTALSPADCIDRLKRSDPVRLADIGGPLAGIRQQIMLRANGQFILERTFPWAIYPIQLRGSLDPEDDGSGTWVHGAVTQDTMNQVMIEGLVLFVLFFLVTVLFFLRLKLRALVITAPLFLLLLLILSRRWRTLRHATEDAARWLRRKLYVLPEQVR